jgi:hypothetical protein
MEMIRQVESARRASAPIVAITTPDPASTIRSIQVVFGDSPLAQWDVVNGVRSMNTLSRAAVTSMHTIEGQLMPAPTITGNPVAALMLSTQWLPDGSILFFHNAHFYVEQTASDSHKPVVQAVWNARDEWRGKRRTLILLAPSFTLPMELRNDVAIIDEPLPTDQDMAAVVARGISRANGRKITRGERAKLIDAVSGLASFNAEQVISMSVSPRTKKPIMEEVWSHKIKLIEQARGLKVYRRGASLNQIGGNANIKNLMVKIARGKRPPRLIVFMDEIEKTMQAAGTDTSGTTTDQLKVLLTKMQDNFWTGFMIYGFAGTGKSQLAKAFGNEAGCPTVEADLGAMKNMWVGSSEANMRSFIKVIEAMGGREVFFVATCNSVVNLPPEFKRRFRKGVWFCDLPAAPERKQIWDIYFRKLGIPMDSPRPNDEGWTGAEIELCCENSHEFGISLEEASRYMTITSQAMGDQVEKMRLAADGKFINAGHTGIYHYKPTPPPALPAPAEKPKKGLIDKLLT